MGVGNFLEQLASAFMQRKRDELGITDREAKTQAAQSEQLLRQAQVQRLMQQLELAPAEAESEQAMRAAQTRYYDAQAVAKGEEKPRTPHYTVDEAGVVHAVTPTAEGGFETTTIGPIGQRPRDVRSPTIHVGGAGIPGTGIQTVGPDGKPAVFYPEAGKLIPLPAGSSFATDVRSERKAAQTATSPLSNVETVANQVEAALDTFERTSMLKHPVDKVVAHSTYKNLLQALAVPWGRLLGDTRISEDDRMAYARSVGEPSIFLRELAPEIARQRLQNLRQVIAEVRAKYGPVLEGSAGMLEAVGGGANLLGKGGAPSGGDVVEFVRDASGKLVRKQREQ